MDSPGAIQGSGLGNFLTLLVVGMLCLGAYLYYPIAIKSMYLKELMGEVTLQSGGANKDEVAERMVLDAERKHDIILFHEDIDFERREKFLRLYVTWRPLILIPLINKDIELKKEYMKERIVF